MSHYVSWPFKFQGKDGLSFYIFPPRSFLLDAHKTESGEGLSEKAVTARQLTTLR
jgi:hypothetical protein